MVLYSIAGKGGGRAVRAGIRTHYLMPLSAFQGPCSCILGKSSLILMLELRFLVRGVADPDLLGRARLYV